MNLTIRQKILQAQDKPTYPVSVPEWCEDDLYIRTLSAADRDEWETKLDKEPGNFRARLVVMALVDADGNRVFEDEDAVALGTKSSAVVSRLFNKASKVNGLLRSDVEDYEKNSARAASDASGSGSPCNGAAPTPSNS